MIAGMRTLLLIPVAALVGACSTPAGLPAAQPCPVGQQPFVSETLYFGTDMAGGSVSQQDWQRFLDDTVTPVFPQGFSVWPAAGQWRLESGAIVRETSFVLNVLRADTPSLEAAVGSIAAAYKARFKQEAVLRVRGRACVSF